MKLPAPGEGEVLHVVAERVGGIAGLHRVGALARGLDHRIAEPVDNERVVAGAARHGVVAGEPVQSVVAAETVERIVLAGSGQGVGDIGAVRDDAPIPSASRRFAFSAE